MQKQETERCVPPAIQPGPALDAGVTGTRGEPGLIPSPLSATRFRISDDIRYGVSTSHEIRRSS